MNYGTIKNCDIANGEGVRVSLFVSGCTHHCHNCFNPETWSFSYGSPFDEQAQANCLRCFPQIISTDCPCWAENRLNRITSGRLSLS